MAPVRPIAGVPTFWRHLTSMAKVKPKAAPSLPWMDDAGTEEELDYRSSPLMSLEDANTLNRVKSISDEIAARRRERHEYEDMTVAAIVPVSDTEIIVPGMLIDRRI